MKVAVLVRPRTIEIQDWQMPEPGPGEARVRVAAVGVCGSDVHYFERGRIGSTVIQYPAVLGHEPSGIVDAVGPDVALNVGTRVAVEPAMVCGRCPWCLAGRSNVCSNLEFLATPPMQGIFCQYRVMPARNCVPIPEGMSLVEAAMLEPLAVGFHAVGLARLTPGETVAVFGSGPIGLVTMLAARTTGASRIYMTDLVPARLATAKKLGADAVMNPADGDVAQWIENLTDGRGVDVAFECAGVQETLTHSCLAAAKCGRVVLVGIPLEDDFSIPMHKCRRKELTMVHVRRSNGEIRAAMPLVASGRLDVKPLVTHFFPLERLAEAFALVNNYGDGVIRAVIQPNGPID